MELNTYVTTTVLVIEVKFDALDTSGWNSTDQDVENNHNKCTRNYTKFEIIPYSNDNNSN